jgi:hypothetical protein
MRILTLVFGSLGLLNASLSATAQTASQPGPMPRFYVGVGAYSSYYQKLGGRPPGTTGFGVPVQLTVGYQLRPRWAVQLGLAHSGSTAHDAGIGYVEYFDPGYHPSDYYYTEARTVRATSVSALARYSLTRHPAHRLQLDALGGLGLEHRSSYTRGTQTYSLGGGSDDVSIMPYSSQNTQNTFLLILGSAARYRLSPRFELNFDAAMNYATSSPSDQARTLTGSTALGLRYRFGRR